MRGFITVRTASGDVDIGIAQICTIRPGGHRVQWANIRMGCGEIIETWESIADVRNMIAEAQEAMEREPDWLDRAAQDAAHEPPDPAPPPAAPPPPEPAKYVDNTFHGKGPSGAIAAAMEEAAFKRETKRKPGRPRKEKNA